MKASEAMRKGTEFRPQVRGRFFAWVDSQKTQVGSCALGAMAEGYTGKMDSPKTNVYSQMPIVMGARATCPESECVVLGNYACVVTHLNDTHKWTREQIADWLEEQGL